MYLDCPVLCLDGSKRFVRVCAEYGGPDADFGNSVLKTRLTVAGTDGPCSCTDSPAMHRSVDLPPICIEGYSCSRCVFIGIP
jgi:hypothetical protein